MGLWQKKRITNLLLTALIVCFFWGCIEKRKPLPVQQNLVQTSIQHASGFTIQQNDLYTVIEVTSAWPGSETTFSYALIPREKLGFNHLAQGCLRCYCRYTGEIYGSHLTTHIPSLEALGVLDALVGFPSTDLVSSIEARKRINSDLIKELGTNENINTEIALELNPEVVIGFGINNTNKAYETLKQSNIPIVYNGDWTEQTPLGKAEWIKFFAPFFQ